MDLGISGKKALISGADSGIGWHTARLLLAEGVTVVITDQDQKSLDEAAKKLKADKGKLFAFSADLTSVDSIAALHESVTDAVGDIDILVQSAGITGAQGLFHEITDEGWTNTILVDLMGPVRLVKAFLPSLRKGGWGRLVFVASEDAVQPYDDEIPYCSAKAGILALAKGLSRSYALEGLLVNCVSPAFIHTPMTDAMMKKRADQLGTSVDKAITSFLDEERPYMELKRRGEPDEVGNVIAFLCSEAASFVNGSNYRVDSGSVATI
ncbi:SDR family NAD(P)-dependent oxidoreductase [Subtercola endophyticus]|uniref:SDR family NAD(P)-dependent oxidoreductase n=1 Tax=Subtercola endophyticus TaxID=2895559 RepID=UPI001E3C2AC7|nr:SDR family oxidoreductase [Subtercola endophyticus]UFS60445.1 SDR family oxidoreductase [Subtercola endophyticus]